MKGKSLLSVGRVKYKTTYLATMPMEQGQVRPYSTTSTSYVQEEEGNYPTLFGGNVRIEKKISMTWIYQSSELAESWTSTICAFCSHRT